MKKMGVQRDEGLVGKGSLAHSWVWSRPVCLADLTLQTQGQDVPLELWPQSLGS